MKKTIRIPNPITLIDKDKNEKGDIVTFASFVRKSLLIGKSFQGGYDGLKAAVEIDNLVGEGKMEIDLEVTSWNLLEKEAKNPTLGTYGLPPLVMIQLTEFIEAIIGASDKKDEKKE